MDLGKAFGRRWSAATSTRRKMHDYRFKQMEYTLPEEYLDEVELERQRKIHDSLITHGPEAHLRQLPRPDARASAARRASRSSRA